MLKRPEEVRSRTSSLKDDAFFLRQRRSMAAALWWPTPVRVLVWGLVLCHHVHGLSVIGFDSVFTNGSAPLAVVECNATCSSPGTVTLSLVVVRSGDLANTQTVYLSTRDATDPNTRSATAGDDYAALQHVPVTFSAGDSQKVIPLTIISDGVYEEDELFEVTLETQDSSVSIPDTAQVAYILIQDGGDCTFELFGMSTDIYCSDNSRCCCPQPGYSHLGPITTRLWRMLERNACELCGVVEPVELSL